MTKPKPSAEFRHLSSEKLIETAEGVWSRIDTRFPDAGLNTVAGTLVDITRTAADRAEKIKEPIWWLRIALIAIALLVVATVVAVAVSLTGTDTFNRAIEFLGKTSGPFVYLGVGVVFLWTLETRWKRWRAVKAIHELRALAHIIDMHQLNKDPDSAKFAGTGVDTILGMRQYLHYCTLLLAILSKIGQLYVQDFPDGTTLSAVDQFENLATGLSQKIWQKLMILEQLDDAPKAKTPTE